MDNRDVNESTPDCSKEKIIAINNDIKITEKHIDDTLDESSPDIVEKVICETSKY